MANLKIIFIADVVGKPGRNVLSHMARRLKYKHRADLVIANTENAAGGFGITPEMAKKAFSYGIDCQTSGNHIWDRPGIGDYMAGEPRFLRPANYPEAKGNGYYIDRDGETPVAVISLMGRTFMYDIDCPFRTADKLLDKIIPTSINVIIVDMHAEATSEKEAMWYYLDGRVSAVIGTHTHVQTADEQISGRGTAYITDVGLTGPHDSILGMKKGPALKRFLSGRPIRLSVAEDDVKISGVILEISPDEGRAVAIERFCMAADLSMPFKDPEEEIVDAGETD